MADHENVLMVKLYAVCCGPVGINKVRWQRCSGAAGCRRHDGLEWTEMIKLWLAVEEGTDASTSDTACGLHAPAWSSHLICASPRLSSLRGIVCACCISDTNACSTSSAVASDSVDTLRSTPKSYRAVIFGAAATLSRIRMGKAGTDDLISGCTRETKALSGKSGDRRSAHT